MKAIFSGFGVVGQLSEESGIPSSSVSESNSNAPISAALPPVSPIRTLFFSCCDLLLDAGRVAMTWSGPLVDGRGRVHTALRDKDSRSDAGEVFTDQR